METHKILQELELNTGTFPRQALREAIAQRERITPALLEILREATEDIDRVVSEASYMAHIYAMYLLAQFRETRAYPLIADFFSIPGEVTLDVTGDVVTEDLHQILASVSGGDTALIERLVEDAQVNEWVRGAALEGLLVLVARGVKSRAEVMGYFQTLFQGGLEREFSHTWNTLIHCCCDLHPEEVMKDIQTAFADGLVDEGFIDFDWVREACSQDKAVVLQRLRENRRYHYIEDTIKEMEWWACFEQPKKPQQGVKVGRNAPCPCGSGKKYKRCCGARR